MSGGGGGIIILKSIVDSGAVSKLDKAKLQDIADRNPIRCSVADALAVLRILWKYLRP